MAMMMMAICSLPFSLCSFPGLRSSSLQTSRIDSGGDFTAQWHHLSPFRTLCGRQVSAQRSGSRRRGNARVTSEKNPCSQQDVEGSQRWPESGRRDVLSAIAMVAVVEILQGDNDARAEEGQQLDYLQREVLWCYACWNTTIAMRLFRSFLFQVKQTFSSSPKFWDCPLQIRRLWTFQAWNPTLTKRKASNFFVRRFGTR